VNVEAFQLKCKKAVSIQLYFNHLLYAFTLESKINWVFAIFDLVFVKFVLGNTTFLLYFLRNYFNCLKHFH